MLSFFEEPWSKYDGSNCQARSVKQEKMKYFTNKLTKYRFKGLKNKTKGSKVLFNS